MLTFVVTVPVIGLALTGFWLNYYKLGTLPLFTAMGAVAGTIVAFIGVVQVVVFGHKEGEGDLDGRHTTGYSHNSYRDDI